MGNELQELMEQENLEVSRENLKQFTNRISRERSFYREIIEVDNENLDGMQLSFLCDNPELSFEEIQLVKKIFDYLKSV